MVLQVSVCDVLSTKHLPTMTLFVGLLVRKKTAFIGPYQFLPSWFAGPTVFAMTVILWLMYEGPPIPGRHNPGT